MPVRADLGVGPFDVVEGQNLIGIFSFIGLQRHKRMIHNEKNFERKKILKNLGKFVGASHIYTYTGGGGVAHRSARARADSAASKRGTIAASVEHFHGSPFPAAMPDKARQDAPSIGGDLGRVWSPSKDAPFPIG